MANPATYSATDLARWGLLEAALESQLQGVGPLAVELALLVPMLRLLEQALQQPALAHTRQELGATLLAYVLDRLAAAGCAIELAHLAAAVNLSPFPVACSRAATARRSAYRPSCDSAPIACRSVAPSMAIC